MVHVHLHPPPPLNPASVAFEPRCTDLEAPSAPAPIPAPHRASLRVAHAAGQPQQLYQPLDLRLLQQQRLLRAAKPALLHPEARPAQPGAPRGVMRHSQLLSGQGHPLLRNRGSSGGGGAAFLLEAPQNSADRLQTDSTGAWPRHAASQWRSRGPRGQKKEVGPGAILAPPPAILSPLALPSDLALIKTLAHFPPGESLWILGYWRNEHIFNRLPIFFYICFFLSPFSTRMVFLKIHACLIALNVGEAQRDSQAPPAPTDTCTDLEPTTQETGLPRCRSPSHTALCQEAPEAGLECWGCQEAGPVPTFQLPSPLPASQRTGLHLGVNAQDFMNGCQCLSTPTRLVPSAEQRHPPPTGCQG